MAALIPDTYYHVYNHANGSENLFRTAENYRFFLEKWGKYIAPVADTYAYCLMPNHVHFLIKTKTEEELFDFAKAKKTSNQPTLTLQGFQTLGGLIPSSSRIISLQLSHLFNSYTQAYNKLYLRKGSLFRPNFKRKQITSDAYLIRVIFYIHHNPLHHGFTRHIADWPHSSYHAVVSDKLTQIKRKEVQDWFGSKQASEKFYNQAIKDLEKLENQFT